MIFLVSTRPNPFPFFLVVKEGEKREGRISGAIPVPVSIMETWQHPSNFKREIDRTPPFGMAWTALKTRFNSADFIASGSKGTKTGSFGTWRSILIERGNAGSLLMNLASSLRKKLISLEDVWIWVGRA